MQAQGQPWYPVQPGRKHDPPRDSIRRPRPCVARPKEKRHQTKMFGGKPKASLQPQSKPGAALLQIIEWPKSIMRSNVRGPSTVRAKNLSAWTVCETPK